jgi:hypothetical protein
MTLKTKLDAESEWLTNASETNRLQASIAELTARVAELALRQAWRNRSDATGTNRGSAAARGGSDA